MKVDNYKDLIVWQKSVDFVELVFKITRNFPKSELYGLVNQIRRAAVAIPSNIAEGAGRQYTKEYIQFLYISLGSAKEVETQLIIAARLEYLPKDDFDKLNDILVEIMKMLRGLCNKLYTTT